MSHSAASSSPEAALSALDWEAVARDAAHILSRYIQFDTTNPPGNELPALEFLAQVLRRHGFAPQIIHSGPQRANLVASLPAAAPVVGPPCLLYAHADVVPADPTDWAAPPFGGSIKDGFVWGRGALDDKGLGVIFIQALSLLKQAGPALNRNITLLIAADEEQSGRYGAAWMLKHKSALIDAEYVWDEGGLGLRQALGQYSYHIAIAEKTSLTLTLIATGTAGHASIPRPDNPHDRLVRALYKIRLWRQPTRLTPVTVQMLQTLAADQPFPRSFLFRRANRSLLQPLLHPWLTRSTLFGPLVRNTINLTMLRGGQASNIVPGRSEARLDARLLPDENPEDFMAELQAVINDPHIEINVDEAPVSPAMAATDTGFYQALTAALRHLDATAVITPYMTPGATDSRFFRAAGMKAYGFMPMQLTGAELTRIHGADERVSIANLGWGIRLVFDTLVRLAGQSSTS